MFNFNSLNEINDFINTGSLDRCVPSIPKAQVALEKACVPMSYVNIREQEKEETMNTYTSATINAQGSVPIESTQRSYLERRLRDAYFDLREKLPSLYGMRDDPGPKTRKELSDRLKKGLYTIQDFNPELDVDDENESDCGWCNAINYLRWRDPAKKQDKVGYEAAQKRLEEALKDTKDAVVIKSLEDGLAAVKNFETANFGPTT